MLWRLLILISMMLLKSGYLDFAWPQTVIDVIRMLWIAQYRVNGTLSGLMHQLCRQSATSEDPVDQGVMIHETTKHKTWAQSLKEAASELNVGGLPTIIYSSRTHSQLAQVMGELRNTSYRHANLNTCNEKYIHTCSECSHKEWEPCHWREKRIYT